MHSPTRRPASPSNSSRRNLRSPCLSTTRSATLTLSKGHKGTGAEARRMHALHSCIRACLHTYVRTNIHSRDTATPRLPRQKAACALYIATKQHSSSLSHATHASVSSERACMHASERQRQRHVQSKQERASPCKAGSRALMRALAGWTPAR